MNNYFYWLITILSIMGVVLNVKRVRACFHVWAVTNAAWMVIDITHGLYAQATLFAVYFLLAIWGIVEWRTKDREA